ncbi:MAG: glycosyltransferase family 39 protein, partial [Patescibacteria group bacterium]
MKEKSFLLSLALISLLGFIVRFVDYDSAPGWNESLDEIHYAWTGQTWFQTGIPTSWSYLSSYPKSEMVKLWDTDFRIVSPMLEKPPLYSLLSGVLVLLFGQDELSEVRISTIRILPLILSIFTIFLTGLLGKKVFGPEVGLSAALLYAAIPPVVLANRLSVTENLLTPIFLISQLIFLSIYRVGKLQHAVYAGIFAALAILTKQIGIVAAFVSLGLLAYKKQWKSFFICGVIAAIAFLIYPLTGAFYDWQLFRNIQTEQRRVGLQGGLPQMVQTIIGRPLVTTERLIPDGVILLGYLLLFTGPWWINQFQSSTKKNSHVIPGLTGDLLNIDSRFRGNDKTSWLMTV